MELTDFKKLELRPVDADFNGLKITVNVNAVTGRHYREVAEKIRLLEEAEKPEQKKRAKIEKQTSALQAQIDQLKEQIGKCSDANKRRPLDEKLAATESRLEELQPTTLELFEGRGKQTEAACLLYAEVLKGSQEEPLLMSWDLTNDGDAVSCTTEELRKLHPELLKELYGFCLTVDHPKSQETRPTPPNRTISEISGDTLPILATQEADDQSTSIS
jgi:septal ring factor EnvC (AmiA/AmiB activator)